MENLMNTYVVTDMYIAAYLQARGFKFTHTTDPRKRVYFNFPEECRQVVAEYVSSSGVNEDNINASKLISAIKELKSFVKSI